ncbi:sporulation protein [Streptomyces xiamenensis]|uniref:sporulation protein n=1 Tax=Streptomyces xiamenensis TaxID=408015 RepID=UPI0036ECD1C8
MARTPNSALGSLIAESGASHKALAHRINQLAARAGVSTSYSHTSVANWISGMKPKPPIPALVAMAIGERLGRAVDPREIGMAKHDQPAPTGLEFPRDPADAARVAAYFWRDMHKRRAFLGGAFAISAYSVPVTRWLVQPAAAAAVEGSGRRVGQQELTELWEAAEQARQWDARYGGGNWRNSQVTDCLTNRAAPLLTGSFTEDVGAGVFSASAELSRLAGWTAFDSGEHDIAQRYFVQALSLARSAGNAELGCYIMATMAVQTMRRGYPNEAIDMAQGAYERARSAASPRVLAFAKLIEARAHGRSGDERIAARALADSERLLDAARDREAPTYIQYFGPPRMASDAVEIYRDLKKPNVALGWDVQATMPQGHTRAVGLRLAVTATAHLQAGDLDQGLAVGRQAVTILSRVDSHRAGEYIRDIHTALAPWRREPAVQAWTADTRRRDTKPV